jgi:hypothetical protein
VIVNNKRKTLQKIAGVGAIATVMPSSWIKPVVSSVVLPVHAQTSVAYVAGTYSGTLTVGSSLTREECVNINDEGLMTYLALETRVIGDISSPPTIRKLQGSVMLPQRFLPLSYCDAPHLVVEHIPIIAITESHITFNFGGCCAAFDYDIPSGECSLDFTQC